MRVVFLGNAEWSVPSLKALAASKHRPVLVLTRTARPAGRGSRLQRTPVAEAADALGLPLSEIETVKAGPGFEALAVAAPEVLVVVAYGEILTEDVLAIPSVAPVNVHFSLLPTLRGAAPVQRAILQGLDPTGVTTIRMDEGVDTGPILLQAEERLRPDDDAGSLGERLAELGGRLLVETLDGLESGTLRERPQDDERATYARKLAPEDRVIDWGQGAEAVVRRVHALSPEPGAETRFRGKLLKIFKASRATVSHPLGWRPDPGTLFTWRTDVGPADPRIERLAVVAGDLGVVVLDEVALEGHKRMTGVEFSRGIRLSDRERLG